MDHGTRSNTTWAATLPHYLAARSGGPVWFSGGLPWYSGIVFTGKWQGTEMMRCYIICTSIYIQFMISGKKHDAMKLPVEVRESSKKRIHNHGVTTPRSVLRPKASVGVQGASQPSLASRLLPPAYYIGGVPRLRRTTPSPASRCFRGWSCCGLGAATCTGARTGRRSCGSNPALPSLGFSTAGAAPATSTA